MKRATAILLLCAAATLGGCGLRPLYEAGGKGPVSRALGGIEVGPIAGKGGWLVRTALQDRIAVSPDAAPRYRLEVELDDQILGFGVRTDNVVTRERRTLRARYKLIDSQGGTVLLDATAGADEGIDVVTSEYAVIAAEQTALERLSGDIADQIFARVALYVSRTAAPPRAP